MYEKELSEDKEVIIIPIQSKLETDLELPIELFKDEKRVITIDSFSKSEREELFEAEFEDKNGEGGVFRYKLRNQSIKDILGPSYQYLYSKHKIIVCVRNEQIKYPFCWETFLMPKLSFTLSLFLNIETNFVFKLSGPSKGWSRYVHQYNYRKTSFLNNENRINLNKGLSKLIQNEFCQRLKVVKSLLEIAKLENTPISLQGSLYITILEIFFLSDGNHELTNKLASRIAAFLKLGYEGFKEIKKLYGFRSKFYHNGISKFEKFHIQKLESIISETVSAYIRDPKLLSPQSLDKNIFEK